ncbi:MAG: methyltransferase domain-containing protein [Myxococcaceae bacterium]
MSTRLLAVWALCFAPLAMADEPEHHHGHDWNAVYEKGTGFSHEANALLVSVAGKAKPGKALDVGMGQGRNALWLARHGWDVTGFDPAEKGVEQAKATAVAEKLKLTATTADSEHFDFGADKWDLVVFAYAGGTDEGPQVVKALRKGGVVVIETFLKSPSAPFGVAPDELAAAFKGLEIVQNEPVKAKADWGLREDQLVRFVAKKK